jgi:hypothetical protein
VKILEAIGLRIESEEFLNKCMEEVETLVEGKKNAYR